MWDNRDDDALFDQYGDFRDQEAYESYIEGYRPPGVIEPELDCDDVDSTINVDNDVIGPPYVGEQYAHVGSYYLGDDRYLFDTDFEAAASAIWHFRRLVGPQPVTGTFDFEVRARGVDTSSLTDLPHEPGHPSACDCPACLLTQRLAFAEEMSKRRRSASHPHSGGSGATDAGPTERPVEAPQAPSAASSGMAAVRQQAAAPSHSQSEPVAPTTRWTFPPQMPLPVRAPPTDQSLHSLHITPGTPRSSPASEPPAPSSPPPATGAQQDSGIAQWLRRLWWPARWLRHGDADGKRQRDDR